MPFGRKKSLMDRAHDYVDQLSDQLTETVIPQLESAWEQAVEKAGPALTDARDKAREWFDRWPKQAYWTTIESWFERPGDVIEFTIRRLPAAD